MKITRPRTEKWKSRFKWKYVYWHIYWAIFNFSQLISCPTLNSSVQTTIKPSELLIWLQTIFLCRTIQIHWNRKSVEIEYSFYSSRQWITLHQISSVPLNIAWNSALWRRCRRCRKEVKGFSSVFLYQRFCEIIRWRSALAVSFQRLQNIFSTSFAEHTVDMRHFVSSTDYLYIALEIDTLQSEILSPFH